MDVEALSFEFINLITDKITLLIGSFISKLKLTWFNTQLRSWNKMQNHIVDFSNQVQDFQVYILHLNFFLETKTTR